MNEETELKLLRSINSLVDSVDKLTAIVKHQKQDINQLKYWILIHHKFIDPSAVKLGEYTCCPPELKEFQNDIATNLGNPGTEG